MTTYLEFVKKSFYRHTAYRSEVWLRVLGNFIVIFIQVSIWKAIIGWRVVEGLNVADMSTYAIINMVLSVLLMTQVLKEVGNALETGDIVIQFIRPLHYPILLFVEQLGRVVYQFLFTVLPSILLSMLFFHLGSPPNLLFTVWFLISLLVAILLSFLIGYFVALIGFWVLSTGSLLWIMNAVIKVFSGFFVPLWFFTDHWASFARLLPFQYLGFVPAAIYMGKISSSDLFSTYYAALIWICILTIGLCILWRIAVRRLVIYGG